MGFKVFDRVEAKEIERKAFNRALRQAIRVAKSFGMTGLPVASAIMALMQPVPKR